MPRMSGFCFITMGTVCLNQRRMGKSGYSIGSVFNLPSPLCPFPAQGLTFMTQQTWPCHSYFHFLLELYPVHSAQYLRLADMDGLTFNLRLRLLQCRTRYQVIPSICRATRKRVRGKAIWLLLIKLIKSSRPELLKLQIFASGNV